MSSAAIGISGGVTLSFTKADGASSRILTNWATGHEVSKAERKHSAAKARYGLTFIRVMLSHAGSEVSLR